MSIVTLNDRAVRSVTTFGSANTGSMVFIKKLTASSSGTLSFVNGSSDVVLDSTYKEYVFTFNNIHSSGDNVNFSFNGSIDSGSNYNATKTTTFFISGHKEDDASTHFDYDTGRDIAQGTGFQKLAYQSGSSNDENLAGTLHLFNPSSTTFVKHFISRTVLNTYHDYLFESYVAGYFNTTSAIDAIQFKMDSGNIDAGDICLYGIL
tara:strand:- start:62 stop:679 length:618 start_codon:yes stop_codon:yes gene_type:complete